MERSPSARVAVRDHNYYFPTEKLNEPISPEDKLGKPLLEKQEFPALLAARGKKKKAGS